MKNNVIKAGVIGYPIKHSLSPIIHNYWLKKYGINGEYKTYEVSPEKLEEFIITLSKQNLSGINVTIPHKEKTFGILENKTAAAKTIGAINTVYFKDGLLIGDNTDYKGFWLNIKDNIIIKKKAVIIGAGGASSAIVYALLKNNYDNVTITNRTIEKAETLANKFGDKVSVCKWEDRNDILSDADLLVNTTSLGMVGQAELDIDLNKLPKNAVVNDIVYNPLMTKLLIDAKSRGNIIVDGLGMLLYQAAPGFKMWFDRDGKYIPKTHNNPEGLPEVTKDLRNKLINE